DGSRSVAVIGCALSAAVKPRKPLVRPSAADWLGAVLSRRNELVNGLLWDPSGPIERCGAIGRRPVQPEIEPRCKHVRLERHPNARTQRCSKIQREFGPRCSRDAQTGAGNKI